LKDRKHLPLSGYKIEIEVNACILPFWPISKSIYF
jgi:hypothetical protein